MTDVLMKESVALVGFRCTGKTSVGKALAERTGWALVDTDTLVEERAGKTISRIFEEDGEAVFRSMEKAVLAEVCSGGRRVVSTGGGIVMDPENVRLLKEHALVVLLQADVDTIVERMLRDPATVSNRPALTTLSLREEVEHLLEKRREAYLDAADVVFDSSSNGVDAIVEGIIGVMRERGMI